MKREWTQQIVHVIVNHIMDIIELNLIVIFLLLLFN